jgi:hypothetical protein
MVANLCRVMADQRIPVNLGFGDLGLELENDRQH